MPLRKDPSEIISDSEPERLRQAALRENAGHTKGSLNVPGVVKEVIEISSDDEDEDIFMPNRSKATTRNGVSRPTARRKIIESSDEEEEVEFVEYVPPPTSTSKKSVASRPVAGLQEPGATSTTPSSKGKGRVAPSPAPVDTTNTLTQDIPPTVLSLLATPGHPVRASFDESLFVLDEPRSGRKPKRTVGEGSSTTKKGKGAATLSTVTETLSTTVNTATVPATPKRTTKKTTAATVTPASTSVSVSATPGSSSKAPRVTKKRLAEIEAQKRHDYAQALFTELNTTIFGGRLPESTTLNWSKRLLTTAGRAKWHRSRDGIQTTEIELAEKILDCEERIKMTLSHEMCHLATWVIDEQIKEHHGPHFMRWAQRLERLRPDIEVSVKHDYEINHPYSWKCNNCDKIYGRHSKSINPDQVVCGVCLQGRLVPQFEVKTRAQKTTSRMAAAKPQDSPLSTPIRNANKTETPPAPSEPLPFDDSPYEDDDSENDSEVEVLAMTLNKTSLQDIP